MPNLFTRAETAILNPLRRPALSGVAEHGAFWSLAALVVLVLLRLLPGPSGLLSTLALTVVIPVWLVFSCIILYRWLVHYVLWKVRNRLVVTYLLMALAPMVLFVTLATIAAYVFAGQFATFAATSELETMLGRLGAENQAFAVHVAHAIARAPTAHAVELGDYDAANHSIPGRLRVDSWVSSQTDNRQLLLVSDAIERLKHNPDNPMTFPPWARDSRGVVLDNDRLFLRAINSRPGGDHTVPFVSSAPLDPAPVSPLPQGLGVVHVI